MQCHKYARGQCRVSHSLSISKANNLVIDYLEDCVARSVFPVAPQAVPKKSGPDYEHLIAVERVKLRRVLEAYEAGIDTLQEYAAKKARLSAGIAELERQAAEAEQKTRDETIDPMSYRKKVLDVLAVVKDPSTSEAEKNQALRSIISYIVYDKPARSLAVFFYP